MSKQNNNLNGDLKMNNIEKVISAIKDPAAAEWFDTNSNSREAISEYAKNGMDIILDENDTLYIWGNLNPFFMHEISGDVARRCDWYNDFESMDNDSWGYHEGHNGNCLDWLEVGKLVEVV